MKRTLERAQQSVDSIGETIALLSYPKTQGDVGDNCLAKWDVFRKLWLTTWSLYRVAWGLRSRQNEALGPPLGDYCSSGRGASSYLTIFSGLSVMVL